MGISWSAMRKQLEQNWICPALRGRVQYFAARYRKTHDSEGGVAIRVDGKELFRSDYFQWCDKVHEGRKQPQCHCWEDCHDYAVTQGGFDQFTFYEAFYIYANQDIRRSIQSPNPVVRLFAILDRRVGTRTLRALAGEIGSQPEWLQPFYRLRLEAQGIRRQRNADEEKEEAHGLL